MCSIGEDDFGDEGGVHAMMPGQLQLPEELDHSSCCKKCNKKDVVVYKLSFRDFECRDCFLLNARHKFRATLGSSKILPKDANVLLIFDGSAEAVVLLDMLYHAQTQKNFKRLHCKACILCVDETILGNGAEDQATQRIMALHAHLGAYPEFKRFITSIASVGDSPCMEFVNAETYLKREEQAEVDFMKRVGAIRSLTSRQEFIKYHRNHVIANAAKQLDCAYVFLPDISITLATQLLTAIALGRGASAAYDVSLVDDRLAYNIQVIRPLRDLSQAEVDLYLRVQCLLPSKTKEDNYGAKRGAGASLQNLTSAFIENLQENYSATVSTVFRSCDKIAPNRKLRLHMSTTSLDDHSSIDVSQTLSDVCSFCRSPLETTSCNTLLAIEFSRLMSERGATLTGESDLDSVARNNLSHINDVKSLCRACRNIQKDSIVDML